MPETGPVQPDSDRVPPDPRRDDPPSWTDADATLHRSLACRRCGYELRGLRVDTRCPECGLRVLATVLEAIDPRAARLPALRNPRAVGGAVVTVVWSTGLAVLLAALRPAAQRIDLLAPTITGDLAAWLPRWLPWGSVALLLVAALAAGAMRPPPEAAGDLWVRRLVGRLQAGLVALAAVAVGIAILDLGPPVTPAERAVLLLGAVVLAWPLLGLRMVLRVIGERSREYRTARGGRQGLRDMVAATGGVAAGELLRVAGRVLEPPAGRPRSSVAAGLEQVGTVVIWVSAFMLLVGFAYLAVNAWWIRRALRRPVMTYGALLEPGPEPEPEPEPKPELEPTSEPGRDRDADAEPRPEAG